MHLKGRKATGPDGLCAEVLKLFAKGLELIARVFNNMCSTGEIPQKWLESKMDGSCYFDDYRMIS